jgi:hypothetical protein
MKQNAILNRTPFLLLLVSLVFMWLHDVRCAAQVVDTTQVPDASAPGGQRQRDPDDLWTEQQKHEIVKKQNEHRQQEIKKDTDKLLELATELKQYVDKTNENIVSLDVIKKAEQIEKLAKSVKDKMKGP